MNKQDIIDKLSVKLSKKEGKGVNYPKWELCGIIEPFLEIVLEALDNGEDVQLSNFGKFAVKENKTRNYYNMQKGKVELSSAKRTITFTPNKKLFAAQKEEEE